MKYIFYLIVTVLISCTPSKKIDSNLEFLNPLDIKNPALIEEIRKYYRSNIEGMNVENIISIECYDKQDTVVFIISTELNLFSLYNRPPVAYCRIDEINIIIRSRLTEYLHISNQYLDYIGEKLFPKQFLLFKNKGDFPVPITYTCEIWILKFKNNLLISKEFN